MNRQIWNMSIFNKLLLHLYVFDVLLSVINLLRSFDNLCSKKKKRICSRCCHHFRLHFRFIHSAKEKCCGKCASDLEKVSNDISCSHDKHRLSTGLCLQYRHYHHTHSTAIAYHWVVKLKTVRALSCFSGCYMHVYT